MTPGYDTETFHSSPSPSLLSSLEPKLPLFLKTTGLASLSTPERPTSSSVDIYTQKEIKGGKGDNKIDVGYFDFHSTIGIRTNTRPRSDAVITINIYTTRRLLKLISTAPQLARSLARRNCVRAEPLTPPAISCAPSARARLFTASWCVEGAARLHSRTPCLRSPVGPTQPKHQTS